MLLALLLVVGQVHDMHTRENMRTGGRGGAVSQRAPLCDIITSDDKAGAWECMKGDGSMATGSATTFVAKGTPTNSTENGFAVRSYTASQGDEQPANGAFPASSFSVCMHHRSTTNAVAQQMAFGTSGAAANFVALPWEIQGAGGDWISYVSDGTAGTALASSSSLSTGTWYLLCFTYERVGGAANNVARTYVNGTQTATSSLYRLAQALSGKWSTNGYVGGVTGGVKSTRGVFITYKVLSAADITRLYGKLAQ